MDVMIQRGILEGMVEGRQHHDVDRSLSRSRTCYKKVLLSFFKHATNMSLKSKEYLQMPTRKRVVFVMFYYAFTAVVLTDIF